MCALGVANGVYAAAAIGSMMGLAGKGAGSREGVRMGLWGAAQAMALGVGGFVGAGLVDIARLALGLGARRLYVRVCRRGARPS